jgi:hypothetical protein
MGEDIVVEVDDLVVKIASLAPRFSARVLIG